VAEERARHPGAAVELWAFDEHRAGLKPVLRRVWAERGRRPVALAEPRYEWLYLYGFVRPVTGAVEWFLCTAVNTALFAAVLARFAAAVGAGPDKRVIPVRDGAGGHGGGRLTPPEGVRLAFLPPYSPELQPAERLWPLTRACPRALTRGRPSPTGTSPTSVTSTRPSPRAAWPSLSSPMSSRPTPASTGGLKPPE
jgi:DDE superfamily endonuclease